MPENWEIQLQKSLELYKDKIPYDLTEEERNKLMDEIILFEAKVLQDRYRATYSSSEHIISKAFNQGLHKKLEPLYTQYKTSEKETNGLLRAAADGFSAGFNAGLTSEVISSVKFGKGGAVNSKETSKYLDVPATKDGTLNIGAGKRPINGAYNIDIEPSVNGVYAGNVTNLSNIATGSQSKVIMQNPYKYDVLNPEISRVLKNGGKLEITGGLSNKTFNTIYKMSEDNLKSAGYALVSKGEAVNVAKGLTTEGIAVNGKIMEIILIKN